MADVRAFARRAGWELSRWRRRLHRLSQLPAGPTALLVSDAQEIAQTQIYPFHAYAARIERQVGMRLIEIDREVLAASSAAVTRPFDQVRWVGFQAMLNCPLDLLAAQVGQLKRLFPNAALVYFDWYAPLDLRHAELLDPWISAYVKKQTFADLRRYAHPTLADTNLMDYFGKRYQIDYASTEHELPPDFDKKLVVGTNFCVSAPMFDRFLGNMPIGARDIDVHARITVAGTDWYQRMRAEALDWAESMPGVVTVSKGRVSKRQFLGELERSKICFSAFGYGEVCWRDFEAVFSGALLLKPRMDHARVEPDIFVDGKTYVAIEWDGSDYREKVAYYLAHEDERQRIAENAYAVVQRYLREAPFVDTLCRVIGRA